MARLDGCRFAAVCGWVLGVSHEKPSPRHVARMASATPVLPGSSPRITVGLVVVGAVNEPTGWGGPRYHPPTSKFGQPPQHSTTTQGVQPGQNSTQSRCDRQRHWGYWGSSPTLLRSNHAGQLVCHHGGVVRLQVQPEMHAIQGCRVQTRPAWPHPAMVVWWTSSSVAGDTTGLWYEGSGIGALGGCTSCHCRGP